MVFRRTLRSEDLWSGEMTGVVVDGVPILLVNIDHQVHAFEDHCAHQRVRLSEGRLAGCVLTCKAHGWTYDARTGHGLNPDHVALRSFPVRIEGGDILVGVEVST